MATSYERVLEAARRYSRDPRLQELPRDTSGRQHAQCSCPAHDGDGGTSLHITYDQSNGKTMLHCFGAEHCDAAAIADALGLTAKGRVQPGKDADLLIFGDELELADVFMKGRRMMQDGKVIVTGAFEA